MTISSEGSKEQRSTTIPRGSTRQAAGKRPTPLWGEDIVSSARKRAAVLEVFQDNWNVMKDGCWNWKGGKSHGYGTFRVKSVQGTTPMYAHRVSYLLNFGPIPHKMHVCHKCDNEACVNPEHLFLGTSADNLADMRNKKRHAYGKRNGMAKLSEETVAEIRELVNSGERQYKIAQKFGISDAQVSRIKNGKHWPEAEGEIQNKHGNFKHGRYIASSDEDK